MASTGRHVGTLASKLQGQGSLRQQELHGQQGAFRLAMDANDRMAEQLHFAQRPFIGTEETLITPPPAIELPGCASGQAFAIKHVGDEPDVAEPTTLASPKV